MDRRIFMLATLAGTVCAGPLRASPALNGINARFLLIIDTWSKASVHERAMGAFLDDMARYATQVIEAAPTAGIEALAVAYKYLNNVLVALQDAERTMEPGNPNYPRLKATIGLVKAAMKSVASAALKNHGVSLAELIAMGSKVDLPEIPPYLGSAPG